MNLIVPKPAKNRPSSSWVVVDHQKLADPVTIERAVFIHRGVRYAFIAVPVRA